MQLASTTKPTIVSKVMKSLRNLLTIGGILLATLPTTMKAEDPQPNQPPCEHSYSGGSDCSGSVKSEELPFKGNNPYTPSGVTVGKPKTCSKCGETESGESHSVTYSPASLTTIGEHEVTASCPKGCSISGGTVVLFDAEYFFTDRETGSVSTENRYVISAGSEWLNIQLMACIIIKSDPSSHENKLTVSFNSDSDLKIDPLRGDISKITDSAYCYASFIESRTELHPMPRRVNIYLLFNGDYSVVAEGRYFYVIPVFMYYTDSLGTVGGVEEFSTALDYVRWKYSFLGTYPVGYDPDQSEIGYTYLGDVTVGSSAFTNENLLASTILHELVHVRQGSATIFKSNLSWMSGGAHYAEVEAYTEELANMSNTGFTDSVNINACIRWYSRSPGATDPFQ